MTEPVKLPDIITHIFECQMRLTERELISTWAPIGKDGKIVEIRYVASKAVSA